MNSHLSRWTCPICGEENTSDLDLLDSGTVLICVNNHKVVVTLGVRHYVEFDGAKVDTSGMTPTSERNEMMPVFASSAAALVTRAEFEALSLREMRHYIALSGRIDDLVEGFNALRELVHALAEPASGQTVRALAQKLKEGR